MSRDEPEYDVLSHYGVIAATERAIKVYLQPLDVRDPISVWIPRSVLLDADEPDQGDPAGELEVKAWYLDKEGLR